MKMSGFRGKWIAAGVAVLALAVAWRLLPVGAWLGALEERLSGMGIRGALIYAAVWILASLLFVPGSILTLGAGYLFGLAGGLAVVWLSAIVAATLGFGIARYVARNRVERLARSSRRFGAIDEAVGENDWKLVSLLRLSPLVPFSLSNYLYGLSAVRFGPYLAATAIASLPGLFFYAYLGAAGKSLSERGSLGPWEWTLLGVGIATTVATTVVVTRVAKRELRKKRD
jgi:uncharacterized membrane protein YdjX (TVP38/TMEM64 family)